MCYQPKTTRRRGDIYALILAAADILGEFSPEHLTPAISKSQADRNCLALAASGRLRVVRRGGPGLRDKPPIYAKVSL